MTYRPVTDISDIDLSRHVLIEASAGTGKTYALENLVVQLLKDRQDLSLENILMVTFTEKATSELKVRIQEKLALEAAAAPNTADNGWTAGRIRGILDLFDTAAIYTIHGFCHTILRDFAFENGSLLQNEVVDDTPVFDAMLREQMRKAWPQWYGKELADVLQMSGFHTRKERFLTQVVSIAKRIYRPGIGDRLAPCDGSEDFDRLRSAVSRQVSRLRSLVGNPPAFSSGFRQLNFHAGSRNLLLKKMVLPIESFLPAFDESSPAIAPLAALMDGLRTVRSSGRQGIDCLVPEKWTKAGQNLHVCPNLVDIRDRLAGLEEILSRLAYHLAAQAIRQLQADAAEIKEQNGWISYDDMLSRVAAALDEGRDSPLAQTLRSRYRIAFLDEFQDTDPVQWRIFQRLFLDDTDGSSDNRLVLIGDPKQAIYSFRGADVFAYLDARYRIEQLSRKDGACLYSLGINYRSLPALAAAFNTLFCQPDWFPAQDETGAYQIGYGETGSPDVSELPAALAVDGSGRAAMNVIDLTEAPSPRLAKTTLSRFVAEEIRRLIDGGNTEIKNRSNESRPLAPGDIAILVRNRSDASFLEPSLSGLGIPYSFYKKPGLFLSDEALYIGLVCRGILDPADAPAVKKALLTPFFAFAPNDLYAYEDLPSAHPLKQLLYQWHDLARGRKWGVLFQSLMADTGWLFRTAREETWDRQATNVRQIFEHLEAVAYRQNLDLRELSALLDSYRKQSLAVEEDADIHQIETESQKVQIMTMHVSKGLQFPVVFIAGGLTQRADDNVHIYHDFDPADPGGGVYKVIDLSGSVAREKHAREREDEDRRLFYVALTRAQFKLYVPYYPVSRRAPWVGPVCRFVSSAIGSAFPRDTDASDVLWLAPGRPESGKPDLEKTDTKTKSTAIDRIAPLPPLPSDRDFRSRRVLLQSFTGLRIRQDPYPGGQAGEMGFLADRPKGREDDEALFASDSALFSSTPSADELPGGADTGSMLHDILEAIDFGAVADSEGESIADEGTNGIIHHAMDLYRVDHSWYPRICRMLINALRTPIGSDQKPFSLGRLKREDRIHEIEFYYPLTLSADMSPEIPDCDVDVNKPRMIHGYVDLVFRHGGKYFIADWKSNRLDGGYGPQAMEDCMNEAGYHMQYKLYTLAMLRWLAQALGSNSEAQDRFGGVLYFFLRGMGGERNAGVYSVSPSRLTPSERLETELMHQIAERD